MEQLKRSPCHSGHRQISPMSAMPLAAASWQRPWPPAQRPLSGLYGQNSGLGSKFVTRRNEYRIYRMVATKNIILSMKKKYLNGGIFSKKVNNFTSNEYGGRVIQEIGDESIIVRESGNIDRIQNAVSLYRSNFYGVILLTSICISSAAPARVFEVAEQDGGAVMAPTQTITRPWGVGEPTSGEAAVDAELDSGIPARAVTQMRAPAIPDGWRNAVVQAASRARISPDLLAALVHQESGWRSDARSAKGAIGLAQLMPATARQLGVDPLDPASNLLGGARYLRDMLDRFGGDVVLALAAYNAGPARVARDQAVPAIAETQAYVNHVLDRLTALQTASIQGMLP